METLPLRNCGVYHRCFQKAEYKQELFFIFKASYPIFNIVYVSIIDGVAVCTFNSFLEME